MNGRKGELSFDAILAIAIITLLFATVIAVLQFQNSQNPPPESGKDIIASYDLLLKSLRHDAKFAARFKPSDDGKSVILFSSNNEKISQYTLIDTNLFRVEAGKEQLLCSKIGLANFKLHPELENLLITTLLPEDKMQIPFFTSFALRGTPDES